MGGRRGRGGDGWFRAFLGGGWGWRGGVGRVAAGSRQRAKAAKHAGATLRTRRPLWSMRAAAFFALPMDSFHCYRGTRFIQERAVGLGAGVGGVGGRLGEVAGAELVGVGLGVVVWSSCVRAS